MVTVTGTVTITGTVRVMATVFITETGTDTETVTTNMTTSLSVTAAVTKKLTLPVHHHNRDCTLALALGLTQGQCPLQSPGVATGIGRNKSPIHRQCPKQGELELTRPTQ